MYTRKIKAETMSNDALVSDILLLLNPNNNDTTCIFNLLASLDKAGIYCT